MEEEEEAVQGPKNEKHGVLLPHSCYKEVRVYKWAEMCERMRKGGDGWGKVTVWGNARKLIRVFLSLSQGYVQGLRIRMDPCNAVSFTGSSRDPVWCRCLCKCKACTCRVCVGCVWAPSYSMSEQLRNEEVLQQDILEEKITQCMLGEETVFMFVVLCK